MNDIYDEGNLSLLLSEQATVLRPSEAAGQANLFGWGQSVLSAAPMTVLRR